MENSRKTILVHRGVVNITGNGWTNIIFREIGKLKPRSRRRRTILVTGAGQGIGYELCIALDKANYKVIAISKTAENLRELKTKVPAIETIQLDLSDWNETKKVLGSINQSLDGLVNNAGIAIIKKFEDLTEEDYDRTMNVNLKACFNVTQTLLPKLKDSASIVNVSSLASMKAFDSHSVYSMSKGGLDSFTQSLALELGPRKIRVNSVNPTVILTRMGRENWSDPNKADPLLSKIPLRRFGEVEEVINPIMFLLSDKSSFINGQSLPIEGGFLAGQ